MRRRRILSICNVFSSYSKESCQRLVSETVRIAEEISGEADVLIIDQQDENIEKDIMKFGISKLYYMKAAKYIPDEVCLNTIGDLIEETKPEIVLFASSFLTKNIAPQLAAKYRTGLTADCISFSIVPDTQKLIQIRPALENQVLAHISCPHGMPKMATVISEQFENQIRGERKTELIHIPQKQLVNNGNEKLVDYTEEDNENNFENSDCVVIVGRGATQPDVFSKIMEFAKLLNAKIGATRAVVNDGVLEHKYQIGLTGSSISCKLCFSFGVSGASQHLIGLKNIEKLVAVNSDSNANIFTCCDYGIVGDVHEVIAEMLEYANENRERIVTNGKRRGL